MIGFPDREQRRRNRRSINRAVIVRLVVLSALVTYVGGRIGLAPRQGVGESIVGGLSIGLGIGLAAWSVRRHDRRRCGFADRGR